MTARIHARWTAVAIGVLMLVATAALAQYSTNREALNRGAGRRHPDRPGRLDAAGRKRQLEGLHLPRERARPAAEPDRRQQVRRRHEPGQGTSYARAEHALTVGLIPQWQASYDFAGAHLGAPPATNNLGSFSVNPTVPQDYIHLASWVDVNAPTAFNFYYLAYDAAEVQFAQPGQSQGPAWGGLMLR